MFLFLGGLLASRLFFIQVKGHDFYLVQSDRQYSFYKSPESISLRGSIYFKEKGGEIISAATIKDGFLVAVNPDLINKPEYVCGEIGKIVFAGFDKDDCAKRAGKKGDPYEVVAHRLDSGESEKIQALGIGGVNTFREQWRFYPGNSFASQVLGFVGYKGDDLVGRYGLEQYYEDILRGEKENLKESASFAMLFLELGKNFLGTDAYGGHDIVLTIEPRVQSFLENVLVDVVAKWSAESAGGVIIDPKTGAIYAMSSKPDFNPNTYGEVDNISYFRNPLVSSIFEVGSVMKTLTLAAALDAGKITAETTYFDNGFLVFNGKRIENYDGKGRGTIDMQTVLNQSLNTGAVFAMQQLGKDKFLNYLKNFGLDEITGIDLPDEIEGRLTNLSSMRDIEYATASFGQGIAVSPIEFTMAVSSLANGGLLMEPRVVEKIIVQGGQNNEMKPVISRRVLKSETSREITRMLVNVVDEALLGGAEKMEHYTVAAKTGTAQLVNVGGTGYYDDQYFHSFFGYAPAFDAKFLIFLYVKKPQGVKYASNTLTEPFMNLMKFLLNYYEVPPDR